MSKSGADIRDSDATTRSEAARTMGAARTPAKGEATRRNEQACDGGASTPSSPNPTARTATVCPNEVAPKTTTKPFSLLPGAITLLITTSLLAASGHNVRGAHGIAAPQSQWVSLKPDGKITYKTREQGDRILDFSFSGYRGGGVKIPSAAVQRTVRPSGGDDTAAIQEAIEAVSRQEAVLGIRGAVLLTPGIFQCKGVLTLKTGGVTLRGSGSGAANGTILRMTDAPHVCIAITSAASITEAHLSTAITDAYVPSGANSFTVADATGFQVGDAVLIRRPSTDAWIALMGMDKMVRDGKKETWVSGVIRTERVVKAISGNRITLDIPLTDSFDSRYLSPPGGSLVKAVVSGRIAQIGVENLRIVSPPQAVTIVEPLYQAIRINGAEDVWVKDIAIEDTVNSVVVGSDARRITVQNVQVTHSVATKGAAKPADFAAGGSQILFDRCTSRGNNLFYFITGARVTGPNVLLHCTFHGNGHIQPHARWATGLLVDSCETPESGIDFRNRGEMGSGHGWTIGWAVAWNCTAKSYVIQQPPGAANWAIGCRGAQETAVMPFGKGPTLPVGIFDSHGTPVSPASLYLAQLQERLGPQSLKNIGY
jgi:hypothetical protein